MMGGLDRITRALRFALRCILWLVVWGCTLVLSTDPVLGYLVADDSRQGYAASVGLIGPLVIIPVGLLLSCLVFAIWKRLWLSLVLAIVVAAGTVVAPFVLGAATIR